ncbi:hypothetical protein CEE44_03885 [Candidatus Woesearchaeota archaeon B3_Woes]|nr:MAG: hypothetical protein CEE44_03885 [Candidatus Woesearchaeota archaeon B3_Woes]
MYEFINIKRYDYSNKYQNIEMVIFSIAGFFIPFFIGHPQLLVGALVNAFLISAGIHLKGYRIWPIILMPSLGVLSRGIIFGPFTPYLLYLIPFIWIGNSLLVITFKYFKTHKKMNYWLTLAIGIILKAGFLFTITYLLFKLSVLPVIFLTAMGILQVITALIGGLLAFGYEKINYKLLTI